MKMAAMTSIGQIRRILTAMENTVKKSKRDFYAQL